MKLAKALWVSLVTVIFLSLLSGILSTDPNSGDAVTSRSRQRRVRVKKVRIDLTPVTSSTTTSLTPAIDTEQVATQPPKKRRKKVKIPIYKSKTVFRVKPEKLLPNAHSYPKENSEKGAKYHAKSTDKVLLTRQPLLDSDELAPTPPANYKHLRSGYKDSTRRVNSQTYPLQHTEAKGTPSDGHSVSIRHPPVGDATPPQIPLHHEETIKQNKLKEQEQERTSKKAKEDYEKDKPFFPETYYNGGDYFSKPPEDKPKPPKRKLKYGDRTPVDIVTKLAKFPKQPQPQPYHHDVPQAENKPYHHDVPQAENKPYHHDVLQARHKSYHHDVPQAEHKPYHHDVPRQLPESHPSDSKPKSQRLEDSQGQNGLDVSVPDVPPLPQLKKAGRGPRYLQDDDDDDDDDDIPPPPQSRPIYRIQRPPQAHYSPPQPHYYSAPRPLPHYHHSHVPPPPEPYPNEPEGSKESVELPPLPSRGYLSSPPRHPPYHSKPHHFHHVHGPKPYHQMHIPQPVNLHVPKPYMRNPSPFFDSGSEEDPDSSPERRPPLHRLPNLHQRKPYQKQRHRKPKSHKKHYYHGADGPVYKAPGYSKEDDDDENDSGSESKSKEKDEFESLQIVEPEDQFEKDFQRVRYNGGVNSEKDGERLVHVQGPVKRPKKTREEPKNHGPLRLRPEYTVPVYYSRPRVIVRPKHYHSPKHQYQPALRPPPVNYAPKEVRPQQPVDPTALGFSKPFMHFIGKLKHFERLYV